MERSNEKIERFHIVSQEDVNKYDLDAERADYANDYVKKFVPDKELKELILHHNPVPNNILDVHRLDSFMKEILKEKRKRTELSMESVLEKLQAKTREVYGPLARVWSYLEDLNESRDTSVEVDINSLLDCTQKTVLLLLSQAINSILYQRRFNTLSAILPYSESKQIIREKADIMGRNGDLFGKEFNDHLSEMRKAKNQTIAIYSKPSSSKPFLAGPSPSKQRSGGGTKPHFVARETREATKVNFNVPRAPLFNRTKTPYIVPISDLKFVHPVVKQLFVGKDIPNVPLAGRLRHFLASWKLLTRDPVILSVIEGYQIPFLCSPHQESAPKEIHMSQTEKELVTMEVSEMLEKGAITKVVNQKEKGFLSQLFLVGKKDGGHRPVINLKKLNQNIPYHHFKMEGLHYLKFMLQQGDYMCKVDLKDAYFSVPLHKDSKKFIRFQWTGNIYEFLCLCFGLGPAPRVFTKILKIPIAILRRLKIRIIIYLDDMLMLAKSIQEILIAKDTVIYLLQHLGFVINLKKSVLIPTQKIEFLGLIIDSVELTLSLTQEKLDKINQLCLRMNKAPQVSVLELTKLIGLLNSTAQAVLPAKIQLRYLQQAQIQALNQTHSYQQKIVLSNHCKQELQWWIENLRLSNGRCLIQSPAELIIQTDASKTGWGAACQGQTTRGCWSVQEQSLHINILELLAVKLALLSFTKNRNVRSIHFQVDNTTALAYLLKMGGTKCLRIIELNKEIWEFLISRGIAVTAEYLPSAMNIWADRES